MVLDIVLLVLLLLFGFLGYQSGILAEGWKLAIFVVAGAVGKLASAPVGRFLVKGVDWAPDFAAGLAFVCISGVLLLAGFFALNKAIAAARQHDGGAAKQILGALLGMLNAAVLVYMLLCSATLLTRHLGARKEAFAFQYQKSRVAGWVLTHNVADPEPFPHARVLKALVGTSDPGALEPGDPFALGGLDAGACRRRDPPCKAAFIWDDPQVLDALRQERWAALRGDPRMLELLTDREFLYAAREYTKVVREDQDVGKKYGDQMR